MAIVDTPRAHLPFWKGRGLWRIPNFFRSLYLDAPRIGLSTAGTLHYRRLTIERRARSLPVAPKRGHNDPLPVYFMTGREHWAMTAFCAYSLLHSSESDMQPIIMDDGSLSGSARIELQRILPGARFLTPQECSEQVAIHLAKSRFPALHAMRDQLPLMRKLMDLHAGSSGWKLFLDSDMLFFHDPRWMIAWLKQPRQPVYMHDYQNSYGYSAALLEELLGGPMPPMVNTGLCGLRSDKIDWEQLESWATRLLAKEGVNHFSEQCLTAMLMHKMDGVGAPGDYLVRPSEVEAKHPSAVMHHYVAESRTWYHILGWPAVLRAAT
jgi:hypothetical protein